MEWRSLNFAIQVHAPVVEAEPERRRDVFRDFQVIASSREKALQAVNTALIDLYWEVGATISRKIAAADWGDGVVDQLAAYIARTEPGLRGFTRANLFRMRQFYETYDGDKKVSPLVRQLPWSHHRIILGQSKRPEEREFYMRMAVQERWSKRELKRQLSLSLFARVVLSPPKVSPVVRQTRPEAVNIFKDAYNLEFLVYQPFVQKRTCIERCLKSSSPS